MAITEADADLHQLAAQLTPLLGRLRRAVNRSVRSSVPGLRLPEAQMDVLRVVVTETQPRVQDVAARLHLAPNTVSTLVAALVDRGLVLRRADAEDRRVVRLSPTAQARRRIAAWRARRTDVVDAHLRRLPAADRRALARALPVLERLTESLEDDDG